MSDSNGVADDFDLALLGRRLVLEGMPVQSIIAEEAGVSQSTVSRAIHGRIKTDSDGARKLWTYALGRADLLNSSNLASSSTISKRPKRALRSTPKTRRRTDSAVSSPSPDHQKLAQEALEGLRDYLNDAFDPQLVIEQLAVLRRAQDPLRAHRRRA